MSGDKVICRGCRQPFERSAGRGRPAVRCLKCRGESSSSVFSLDEKEGGKNTVLTEEEVIDPPTFSSPPPSSVLPVKKDKTPQVATGQTFCLMVGNMGLAYAGEDEKEAVKLFTHYSRASSQGYGQVGFEAVQLWKRKENLYELMKDFKVDRTA